MRLSDLKILQKLDNYVIQYLGTFKYEKKTIDVFSRAKIDFQTCVVEGLKLIFGLFFL